MVKKISKCWVKHDSLPKKKNYEDEPYYVVGRSMGKSSLSIDFEELIIPKKKKQNNTRKVNPSSVGVHKKQNNNKTYGLGKERQLKNTLLTDNFAFFSKYVHGIRWSLAPPLDVTRARGSFGNFDVQAFYYGECYLISVKSTRQKVSSYSAEIKKIKGIVVPSYCRKFLCIWWSPRKDRVKSGWEVILVP